ncbi:MAG: Rdx family protein [Gemmataceae bacterium]|nr:Rdx family protein [Gemmataceae bacterium]
MTGKLLNTYKQQIENLKLIPTGGGAFELSLDGELVYSKLKTGQFPEEDWVVDTVGKRLKSLAR